jgi:geranylgeranyl diphosphate synthase, type II
MSETLVKYIEQHREAIESALEEHLPVSSQTGASRLNAALRYAIFPGGKRWRPLLTLLGAEVAGIAPGKAMPVACAMEYLHTSSIIFDDLPAMDDACLRRGKETLHLVCGESLAVLAALALLNQSYGLLSRTAERHGCFRAGITLVGEAVDCIGADGMIGGQVVDLVLKGDGQSDESLVSRNLKTTALMRLTMMSGALACGASESDAAELAEFGATLGMAYQICDDLLDELAASEDLGKPAHQDARHSRSNHVLEIGVEGAHRLASDLVTTGLQRLQDRFGSRPAINLIEDASRIILGGAGRLIEASA